MRPIKVYSIRTMRAIRLIHSVVSLSLVCSMLFYTGVSANVYKDMVSQDYCKKLHKHVGILGEFNELNKKNNIIDLHSYDGFLDSLKKIEYKNEIIKICVAKMLKCASIEPLLRTWDYAHDMCISNEDMVFVREFSILIFSLYENLLVIMTSQKTNEKTCKEIKGTLEDIIQVYNAVSDLPLKEIIMTLEKCYVIFSKILNDYGVHSRMSWGKWFSKYWWLAPTVAIAIIGALLRKKLSRPSFLRF
ncbi:hypothetical protein ACFLYU_04895 [Candidatus Dependentiae bacterium]